METLCFDRLPVPELARWRRESAAAPSRHWEKVSADARGARSLTLWIKPYAVYLPTCEGLELSAFYVASNALHSLVGKSALNMPLKPLITGFGIGAYGRSGVVAIPGIGTRFAAAVTGCDAEPDPKWDWREDRPLSEECTDCRACVSACPNGALIGDGRLNTDSCLRAQAQYQSPPMPYASRERLGSSIWGCEICQQVCPRNGGQEPVLMPPELEAALTLKMLLQGDVSALGEWIGTNYARPARMQARACLIAANMARRDLLPDIRALLKSQVEPVRDCAAWAIEKLKDGGN